MTSRALVLPFALLLAACLAPPGAVASARPGVAPAVRSPLNPVRLAADFVPRAPAAPDVVAFELAAGDSAASRTDSLSAALPPSPGTSVPPFAPGRAAPLEQPPVVGPVVGAIIGGAVGLYGGGALGVALIDDPTYSDSYEELGAAILGGSIGEVFLMPLGAHVGNGGQGSYWAALGGSALGFLATLGLSYLGPAGAIAGVGLQTALTVSAERRSARFNARLRAAEDGQATPP